MKKEQPVAVSVQVFNASALAITVTVNQGASFSVAATGASTSWVPSTPTSGGPTWTAGYPSQNVLGQNATNTISASVSGTVIGSALTFTLPNSQFTSIQLYVFFATMSSATWMVLVDGSVVTQQTVSALAPAAEHELQEK
jgi:hypothetical protein